MIDRPCRESLFRTQLAGPNVSTLTMRTSLPRREFLSTGLAATAAATLGALTAHGADTPAAPGGSREYYELRAYRLKPGVTDHALLDGYLEHAFIPALNANGIPAVGVFTEPAPKDGAAVWVLIPHASLESVGRVSALEGEPALLAAAGAYLTAPTKAQPAYDRIDTWLSLAFAGMPRHEISKLKRAGQPRIFELRVYESYSEAKARNKVDMFNDGEIQLFLDLGFENVFFGAGIAGSNLPHLAYMLCSPDRATHDAAWKTFFTHPTWLKLKADPRYQDNVSKVISRFFEPTAYSQF